MNRLPTNNDITALATLLKDENEEIVRSAKEKLSALSPKFLSFLRNSAHAQPSDIHGEIVFILEEVRLAQLQKDLKNWSWKKSALHLEKGALILTSMFYPDVDPAKIIQKLDDMAAHVRERAQATDDPERTFYLLNHYLFQELGFKGNAQNYYEPENSFLHLVLDRRVGIPISLSCVLLALAERLDLPLSGVGMPGHFLVRYQGKDSSFYIDAFNRGRILSKEECQKWLSKSGFGFKEDFLRTVTPKEIIGRMIRNLVPIYTQRNDLLKVRILEDCLPFFT